MAWAAATTTATATATPTGECLTHGQRLHLILGITHRFSSVDGDGEYDPDYDVNNDGKINLADLLQVLGTPVCGKKN